MPTYAYACADCGHAFDIVQSFSEDSLTVCPSCGGNLRKQFNAVGVVFKGGGFYRNDSRASSSSSDTAKPSTSTSSSSGDSGSGSSGDSSSGASSTASSAAGSSSTGASSSSAASTSS